MASSNLISLQDPSTGAMARIAPELGFNCFEFLGSSEGDLVDVLWREPEFEMGGKRASGSGIPLLFPFPGRIAGTTFHWDGRDFELTAGDGRGNAIHGFVHERPWRVIAQSDTTATGQFQAAIDDPSLLDCWPSDFRVTATYDIGPNRLRSSFVVENPGTRPLPCGFGTHPYFRLPLGGADAGQCTIQLPVSSMWELRNMNPTGNLLPLSNAADYQQGQAFQTLQLDNVFGDLVFDSEQQLCRAVIEDPVSQCQLTMSFDSAFQACVAYTPPHREAICIEPLTCVPDSFRLERKGVKAGLRILQPGEKFAAQIELRCESRGSR